MANWENIEAIVDHALSLPEDERSRYINETCAGNRQLKDEVTQLLESIADSEGWLENPDRYKNEFYKELAGDMETLQSGQKLTGRQVGSYQIKEELGQGGMGSVYRAERSDGTFEHQVAIKMIRSGRATPENIRRFEQERNILAGLNHPGIAQLFDGGITDDGVPYLIMEYIDGIPIDRYCRKHELSPERCVRLFKKVLQAVMHAHENLVIHRDIKPANILVTEQEDIKILDFGISKLLEETDGPQQANTMTGGRLLTPKYAAPEQIKEEPITTATDLYALGTIFYELLTGHHPLPLQDTSQFETERLILEQNPPAPSRNLLESRKNLRHKLRGDLDAIALKALRKEPERRYRMANHFLYDLQNYQQGLPVTAHANSVGYRTQKFYKRHKYALAAAAAFLALVISFASVYTWRIAEERNIAQLEARKATQIKNLLTEILQQTSPFNQPDRDITLAEVLNKGAKDVQKSLSEQPQVKAELLGLIGDNYTSLGNFKKGEELINEAIDLYKSSPLQSARQTYISNLSRLGRIYVRTGRFKKAKASYLEALELVKREYGEHSAHVSGLYGSLASVYREEGQLLKTEEYFKKALAMADSTQQAEIATSLGNLAIAYRDQGMFDKALDLHKQSLKLEMQVHDSLHPDVASAYNHIAFTYQQRGDFPIADSLHRIALSMRRTLFPPDHHHIASSVVRIGLLKIKQFHTREAEKYLKEGYDILSKKLPQDHWQVISAKGGLALSRAMQGNFEENVPVLENAYHSFVKKFGAKDWRSKEAALALSNIYRLWGKADKAQFYAQRY